MLSVLLRSADPGLGRPDKHSLPQEALMELFIAHITEGKECVYRPPEGNSDLPYWSNMKYNENGEFRRIYWFQRPITGDLAFEWLPDTIEEVQIADHPNISGTLNLDCLPTELHTCRIHSNGFCGEISLVNLPKKLVVLNVSINSLKGALNLERLTESLEELSLHMNKFQGTVNLTLLPKKMNRLRLHENLLSGAPDVTKLPPHMEELLLGANKFQGSIDLSQLPSSLNAIHLCDTALEGDLIVKSLRMLFWAENSRISVHKGPGCGEIRDAGLFLNKA
mmetsp:Transcript_26742/g.41692  ORF Transcript_26742/g.41692 Transcript_26742/m.41692 type:complete len:279 (-) Transcript_26742:23-859(-)